MTKRFPVLLASLLAVSSVSAPLQVLARRRSRLTASPPSSMRT